MGRCNGMLVAVLSTVAAGDPMMFTSLLRPPFMIPRNGWGVRIGGAVEGGCIKWLSTAVIRSPCFAAGMPIRSSTFLIN